MKWTIRLHHSCILFAPLAGFKSDVLKNNPIMSDARSLISSDHIDVFYIYYSSCCNFFYLWLVTRSCCSFILFFFFKNRNCSTINLLNLHDKRKIVFYFCFTFICIFKIALQVQIVMIEVLPYWFIQLKKWNINHRITNFIEMIFISSTM